MNFLSAKLFFLKIKGELTLKQTITSTRLVLFPPFVRVVDDCVRSLFRRWSDTQLSETVGVVIENKKRIKPFICPFHSDFKCQTATELRGKRDRNHEALSICC